MPTRFNQRVIIDQSRNFIIRDDKAYTEDNVLISNLFVFGLNSKITANDLQNYFKSFGEITKCLIKKKRNVPKIGFVNFVDPLVAARVLQILFHRIHFKQFFVKACDSWRQPIAAQMAKDVGCNESYLNIRYKTPVNKILQKPVNEHNNIMRLNDDCLLHILRLLPLREQVRFARTCRRFRNIFQLSGKCEHRELKLKNLVDMTLWEIRDVFEIKGLSIEEISGRFMFHNSERISEFISIFCKNLKVFHIHHRYLRRSRLYCIFNKIKSIQELNLEDCYINDEMISSMIKLPNLKKLILSKNIALTGKNLNLLVNLTSLKLSGCFRIQEKYLIEMCKSLVKLKELDICYCERLYSDFFAELVTNLRELETLKISNDGVGYESIAELPKLKEMILKGVYSTAKNPQLFRNLARYKCDRLEALFLFGDIYINHDNINDIGRLIKLRQLSCANNKSLDDYCLTKLSNLIELEDLDLSGCNQIKDDALVHLVKKCINLKRLNVQNCKSLTNKFIFDVIEVLKNRDVPSKKPLTIFAFGTIIGYFTTNNEDFQAYAKYVKLEKMYSHNLVDWEESCCDF